MKKNYITRQIKKVCFVAKRKAEKNIYEQLEETIAVRKKLLAEWEKIFETNNNSCQKNIHLQLAETIAAFKREKQQLDRRLFGHKRETNLTAAEKKAA
jgi:hypothetical protein